MGSKLFSSPSTLNRQISGSAAFSDGMERKYANVNNYTDKKELASPTRLESQLSHSKDHKVKEGLDISSLRGGENLIDDEKNHR